MSWQLDDGGRLLDSECAVFRKDPVRSRTRGRSQPGEVAYAIPGKDLRRLVNCGANLLVRGEKSAATATVVALSADFPLPLITWMAGTDLELPALDRGTLVIHDVDCLDLAAQRTLLAWLEDRTRRVRVITTVTRDLFAMVTAGVFVEPLYYRLNTIVVDAVGGNEQSVPILRHGAPPPSPHRS
jgi:sigma-54-interacting transcriptional regulator